MWPSSCSSCFFTEALASLKSVSWLRKSWGSQTPLSDGIYYKGDAVAFLVTAWGFRCFVSFGSDRHWPELSSVISRHSIGPLVRMLLHTPANSASVCTPPPPSPAGEECRNAGLRGLLWLGLGILQRLGAPFWIFIASHYISYFPFVSRKYLTIGIFSWCKLFLIDHSYIFLTCSNPGLASLSCTVKIKLLRHRHNKWHLHSTVFVFQ